MEPSEIRDLPDEVAYAAPAVGEPSEEPMEEPVEEPAVVEPAVSLAEVIAAGNAAADAEEAASAIAEPEYIVSVDVATTKLLSGKALEYQDRIDLCIDHHGSNTGFAKYGYVNGKMCICMKRLLRQISYDRLNSISPLSLSSFDNFSLDYYDTKPLEDSRNSPYKQMSRVLSFCVKYARGFSTSSESLLFQGAPGLGKTHLSLAIARDVIESGFGVIYVSAPSIMNKLNKEAFEYDRRSNDSPTEQLLTECDLLIIDDLGTEFSSRFNVAAIYNIINTRMIVSKPTIISTNLTITELQENYNMRIISRIIGNLRRLEFIGTDIRQQKHILKKNKPEEASSAQS